jgi:hypothetical protein
MKTIDKNLLIDCSSKKEADDVFDYLESQGEKTSRNCFHFNTTRNENDWYFIGYYILQKTWTIAKKDSKIFGDKVIYAKEFLGKTEIKPEYVECIKVLEFHYGELGKIYKVENWNYPIGDCMLVGTTSGSTSRDRFKPSTKEAFDAQFDITTSTDMIDKELLIDCSSEEEADRVFDYLKSKGEIIDRTHYNFATKAVNQDWHFVGFNNIYKKWTIARNHLNEFGQTIISAKEFLGETEIITPTLTTTLQNNTSSYATPTIKQKPLIEDVQSISVNLRTKKQINKLKF